MMEGMSARMFALNWVHTPDDVLDAVDMVSAYLLKRAPVRPASKITPAGSSYARKGKWSRAIYAHSLARAKRLLNVQARKKPFDNMFHWTMSPRWEYRLRLAGVDPMTLQVFDSDRWALAWEQLWTTNTFKADIQLKAIAVGCADLVARNHSYTQWINATIKNTWTPNVVELPEEEEEPATVYSGAVKRARRRVIT